MNYQHRVATPHDLPAIVAIYNAAVAARTASCDLEPVSVADRRSWFADRRDTRPLWVGHRAEEPGVVTGYVAFEPFLNGRAGYDRTADLAIYLHPDHQGVGQGHALLGAAVEEAPRLGVEVLAVSIFAANHASVALFTRHGFQQWGRLPGVADLDGVRHDLLFLGRGVTPGGAVPV